MGPSEITLDFTSSSPPFPSLPGPLASLLVLVLGSQASPSETHALSSSDSSITTTPMLREPMMVPHQEPLMLMEHPFNTILSITSLPPCTPTLLYQPLPSEPTFSDLSSSDRMKLPSDQF